MEELPKKPVWKRPLVIVSGAVLLLVALFAGAEIWLGAKIRRTIEQQATTLTGGICRVEVKGVRFNIFNRSVRLRGITLHSDTSALAARASSLADLRIDAEELLIKGIRLKNRDGVRTLTLGSLTLQSPQITLVRDHARRSPEKNPSDSTSHEPRQTFRQQMARTLQKVSIGRLALLDGTIDYCELRNGKRLCHGIGGITVETSNLNLDATSGTPNPPGNSRNSGTSNSADTPNATTPSGAPGHSFCSGDIQVSLNGLSYLLNDGAVKLELDTLSVDTKAGALSLSGVRLLPQFPKDAFASLTRNHADWTQVIAQEVDFTGVDFPALLENKLLRADSVAIRGVELSSYKNRQIAQTPRIKPLFYQTLQKLALGVDIRRIRFDSVDVTYQELSPEGIRPGTITFNNLSGEFDSLTNIASTERSYYTIRARGLLMNRGAVQATFSLPVDSANNRFEVTGTLGALDMTALNPITEPLANLKVNAGKINRMNFKISGGAEHSAVTMTLLYDDLNVILVRDKDGKIKERKFLSAVIDNLVIKHSNPDSRGTRTGTGTAQRDPYRSQFNYLWKSLFPGVKSTLITRNASRLERKEKREQR